METLAVYDEHPIRIYGLEAQEGFCWLTTSRPQAGLAELSDWQSLEQAPSPAFFCATLREGRLVLRMCLAQADLAGMLEALPALGLTPVLPARPVCLIQLQGPHFGDRYGIASAALASLAQVGATPLGMGAVVHSLFLVVEPAQADLALRGLGQAFSAPN
ncbi:MAG: hypothetical protein V1806_06290 [Pseudomonadota bacterium]